MKKTGMPPAPDSQPGPEADAGPSAPVDVRTAEPEEIKAEIARTRAHMDEHLSQLGRKLTPGPKLKRLRYPLAALAVAAAGMLIVRAVRLRARAGSTPKRRP